MKNLLLLIGLIVLLPLQHYGQIISKEEVEERTEEKVDQRVDQKVDQGIDKGLDAIEGLLFGKRKRKKNRDQNNAQEQANEQESSTSSTDQASMNAMSKLLGGGDANVLDQYTFSAYAKVKMTMDGGKETVTMKYHFPENEPYVGIEYLDISSTEEMTSDVFTIMDIKNKQVITLMTQNGQKMGVSINIDPEVWKDYAEENSDVTSEDITIEKTGRTKEILGYTCYEYKMVTPDGNGTIWITDETDLSIGKALMGMQMSQKGQKGKQASVLPSDYPTGAMLEMEFTSTDGEHMLMTTTEINENSSKTVSTTGYSFFNMGGK